MTILKVDHKEIRLDSHQERAFKALVELINSPLYNQSHKSFFSRIFRNPSNHPAQKIGQNRGQKIGFYLYGKVGRGKSMLVKHFFDQFQGQKIYLHFNSFMQKVHAELYKMRQNQGSKEELIELVTKNIIKDTKLLCLDEFQVDDVADALILRRIFSYIFKKDIIVIFTSNSKPENLYQNGLQRDLFLKFVDEVLNKSCQIFNLDSQSDYREQFLHKMKKHYFYPINKVNEELILGITLNLTKGGALQKDEINIGKRVLQIKKSYKNIAIFDFEELCVNNLGVADYQAICSKYDIIFLLNLPKLLKEDRNEAKRLILFIDEVYEKKKTLLVLADVDMGEIYEEGKDSQKFKRTVSRLKEIMSDNYGTSLNSIS